MIPNPHPGCFAVLGRGGGGRNEYPVATGAAGSGIKRLSWISGGAGPVQEQEQGGLSKEQGMSGMNIHGIPGAMDPVEPAQGSAGLIFVIFFS